MGEERYPGEARGLRLFLEGLLVAVEAELGRDVLLYHRIRTALERRDLKSLRDARQMFNHQETELKRRLSLARPGGDGDPLADDRKGDARLGSATVLRLPLPGRPHSPAE
jgi:hypothetical protein